MRRTPPTEFLVSHFGWWRAAIGATATLAATALAVWGWHRGGDASTVTGMVLGGLALAAALSAAGGSRPVRLRWDGEHWHIDGVAGGKDDGQGAQHGLVVAIDIGPWMLLRLRPVLPQPSVRTRWIPVQRRGHEAQWHGMRRAVYFPRSSAGGPPMAEPHPPE
jgi:hypothetical protein